MTLVQPLPSPLPLSPSPLSLYLIQLPPTLLIKSFPSPSLPKNYMLILGGDSILIIMILIH